MKSNLKLKNIFLKFSLIIVNIIFHSRDKRFKLHLNNYVKNVFFFKEFFFLKIKRIDKLSFLKKWRPNM